MPSPPREWHSGTSVNGIRLHLTVQAAGGESNGSVGPMAKRRPQAAGGCSASHRVSRCPCRVPTLCFCRCGLERSHCAHICLCSSGRERLPAKTIARATSGTLHAGFVVVLFECHEVYDGQMSHVGEMPLALVNLLFFFHRGADRSRFKKNLKTKLVVRMLGV